MSEVGTGLRVLLRGPYPPPYGGVATLMVSLVNGLQEVAEEVVALQYGEEESVRVVGSATVYVHVVRKQAWRLALPWNWPLVSRTFSTLRGARLGFKETLAQAVRAILADTLARRHRCNVVHFFQSDLSLEALACRETWGRRRGMVLEVFGEIHDTPEYFHERAGFFRRLFAAPDEVTSSSRHCATSWRVLGVEREIDVIYVGVDADRFVDDGTRRRETREELGIPQDVRVVLFLGRFNSRMGLDALLDLMPGLVEAGGEFRFILAGATGDLTPRAEECGRAFPERVIVRNDVPGAMIPALYAASDVVVAPSRDGHACMGVTIKEAMAASLPVIGTDSGGIPEAIVHGGTGVIVPLRSDGAVDVDPLRDAILELLSDPERARAYGTAGRERALELFSEQATLARTATVLGRARPR